MPRRQVSLCVSGRVLAWAFSTTYSLPMPRKLTQSQRPTSLRRPGTASSTRGLDRIKLATLWALVEAGSAEDTLEQRLDEIRTIPEGDQGPWVDIVPLKMLGALASIASMEEDEHESLADRWGATEELEGWDASEVLDLLRSIGDTAESAQLEKKTLLIWTSL